jgi:hypothetical protein
MLSWKFVYNFLSACTLSFLFGIPGSKIPGHVILLRLKREEQSNCFPDIVAQLYINTIKAWWFWCLHILANTWRCTFILATPGGVPALFNFDLHFPSEAWCWISFHVLAVHKHIIFRGLSTHIFCLSSIGLVFFLALWCRISLYIPFDIFWLFL